MKTRKSITKRFKITKNGKIMRRSTGQNHTRSKKTGQEIRNSRKWILLSKAETKRIKKLLNY
jgi:large subunit ribosomal protein L35